MLKYSSRFLMSPITSTELWAHQGLPSTRLQLSLSSPTPEISGLICCTSGPRSHLPLPRPLFWRPLPFKSSSGCGYLALFRPVTN